MTVIENDAKSTSILLCPICSQQLTSQQRTFLCENNHHFDIAKEGYVNLLRVKKLPKFTGDTKEMLQARRRFLDYGHYVPLAEKIAQNVHGHLAQYQDGHVTEGPAGGSAPVTHPYAILDAGCGEGYYLRHLANHLENTHLASQRLLISLFGMDIAKDGPRMAAKRLPQARFFVADVNQPLLFPTGSVDTILNIFAPRNAPEFARLLNPAGQLMVVIPHANHLQELRSHFNLLEIQPDKENQLIAQMESAALTLNQSEPLSFSVKLEPTQLHSLLYMTPNYRHLSRKNQAQKNQTGEEQAGENQDAILEETIQALENPLRVTASFQLLTFIKG